MTIDPLERLAAQRLVELSASVEVQLEQKASTRPVLYMLREARNHAANAMTQLVSVDCNDAQGIQHLQNEVRRYDDMVIACRNMIERGKEADAQITEEDRQDLYDVVMTPEEQQLYGINQQGID